MNIGELKALIAELPNEVEVAVFHHDHYELGNVTIVPIQNGAEVLTNLSALLNAANDKTEIIIKPDSLHLAISPNGVWVE